MKKIYFPPQVELFRFEGGNVLDASEIQGTAEDFPGDSDWTSQLDVWYDEPWNDEV